VPYPAKQKGYQQEQDSNIAAGDGDDVYDARFCKRLPGSIIQVYFIANKHGLYQSQGSTIPYIL
jgi:hypothetical protein